jgi:ADP-ribosylglycohydrolase
MIGAISGDSIGSAYESQSIKEEGFPLFSPGYVFADDIVLTIAVVDSILTGKGKGYVAALNKWSWVFPCDDYCGMLRGWLGTNDSAPYNSFSNGSANGECLCLELQWQTM